MKRPSTLLIMIAITWTACQQPVEQVLNLNLEQTSDSLQVFAEGTVSTPMYERDLAISPDQQQIIYTLGDYKQTKRMLVACQKSDDSWSAPKTLAFSGEYNDIEPFYSPLDGKLFFASDRPMDGDSSRRNYNIWYVENTESGWSAPVPLDTIINTTGNEFYPSLAKNGNLYFTATRADGIGLEDIFCSPLIDNQYQKPYVLDSAINSRTYEFNAYVHPDENLIIFSSYGRADGLGGGDLYYAVKDSSDQWTAAKNLGDKINSNRLDYCPYWDAQTQTLYFTSDRMDESNYSTPEELNTFLNGTGNGMGDIYRISLNAEVDFN